MDLFNSVGRQFEDGLKSVTSIAKNVPVVGVIADETAKNFEHLAKNAKETAVAMASGDPRKIASTLVENTIETTKDAVETSTNIAKEVVNTANQIGRKFDDGIKSTEKIAKKVPIVGNNTSVTSSKKVDEVIKNGNGTASSVVSGDRNEIGKTIDSAIKNTTNVVENGINNATESSKSIPVFGGIISKTIENAAKLAENAKETASAVVSGDPNKIANAIDSTIKAATETSKDVAKEAMNNADKLSNQIADEIKSTTDIAKSIPGVGVIVDQTSKNVEKLTENVKETATAVMTGNPKVIASKVIDITLDTAKDVVEVTTNVANEVINTTESIEASVFKRFALLGTSVVLQFLKKVLKSFAEKYVAIVVNFLLKIDKACLYVVERGLSFPLYYANKIPVFGPFLVKPFVFVLNIPMKVLSFMGANLKSYAITKETVVPFIDATSTTLHNICKAVDNNKQTTDNSE